MEKNLDIKKIQIKNANIAYIEYGHGPALIVLGGIMARIDSWMYVIEFLAQKFTVYFIELPGYGKSDPIDFDYSSKFMGEVIQEFANKVNLKKFSIIGFSFGSFVSLFALKNIYEMVDKVYLIAPCISYKALNIDKFKLYLSRLAILIVDYKDLYKILINLIKNKKAAEFFIFVLSKMSNNDIYMYKDMLTNSLLSLDPSSIKILLKQLKEVLFLSPIDEIDDINKKIYLGMSKKDQFLSYDITHKILSEKCAHLELMDFNLDKHQPLEPISPEFLRQNFGRILETM